LFGKDDSQGISKIERDLITLLKASKTSTDITFQLNKNLKEHHCITTTIQNSEIGKLTIKPKDLQKNKRPNLQKAYEADIVFVNTKQERIHIQNLGYDVDSFLTLIDSQDLYDNGSKLSKNNSLFYNLAFLLITQNYLRSLIESIIYIDPSENRPNRFFDEEDPKNSLVTNPVHYLVYYLTGPNIPKSNYKKFMKYINDLLKDFGIADEIDVRQSWYSEMTIPCRS